MIRLALIVIATSNLLVAGALIAQDPPMTRTPVYAWGTLALGPSTHSFGAMLGFDVLIHDHLLSIRSSAASELFGDEFEDVGLLYGRVRHLKQGLLAASAGVGVVRGLRCGGVFGDCDKIPAQVGLPVAVRGDWHALRFFGLSLYLYANFNAEEVFGGVLAGVTLGRLR